MNRSKCLQLDKRAHNYAVFGHPEVPDLQRRQKQKEPESRAYPSLAGASFKSAATFIDTK